MNVRVAAVFVLSLALTLVAVSSQAQARDVFYLVTVDGRLLDEKVPGARDRDGFVFVDLVRAVRAFDGLISFKGDTVRVTIGAHSIAYHVGTMDAENGEGKAVPLPAAAFYDRGSIFVPIQSFADMAGATLVVHKDRHVVDFTRGRANLLVPIPTPVPAASST